MKTEKISSRMGVKFSKVTHSHGGNCDNCGNDLSGQKWVAHSTSGILLDHTACKRMCLAELIIDDERNESEDM